MGRHKKPIEEKILEGTWREDRDGKLPDEKPLDDNQSTTDITPYKADNPPPDITNVNAIEAYNSIVIPLKLVPGLIQEQDELVLVEAICRLQAYYRFNTLIEKIWIKKRITVKDETRLGKLDKQASRALKDALQILVIYGVSPTARAKLNQLNSSINPNNNQKKDKLEEMGIK